MLTTGLEVLQGLSALAALYEFAKKRLTKSKMPATAQLKQACVKTRA